MNNLNSYMTFDFDEEDYLDDYIPCDLEEEDYFIDDDVIEFER